MLCDTIARESVSNYLLTPDGELTTEQSTDINEVQCGDPVSFIEIKCRDIGEELTYRNRNDSKMRLYY